MGGNILQGRKAIVEHVGRPWSKIKVWVKKKGFPAANMDGRWESDTELILQWRREQIAHAKKSN